MNEQGLTKKCLLTDKEIDNETPTEDEVLEFMAGLTSNKVAGWDTMTGQERVMTALSILTNIRTAQAQVAKDIPIILEAVKDELENWLMTKLGLNTNTELWNEEWQDFWKGGDVQ